MSICEDAVNTAQSAFERQGDEDSDAVSVLGLLRRSY